MTDRQFSIVPAGAGAGKTHHIKETLTKWVSEGEVRPERILAVTFTEAAASELRQRIRASLLNAGMTQAALAVDRAYVSTIHGLGRRLLVEHALAGGSSPHQRLITDDEQDLLVRQALEKSEVLRTFSGRLRAFGYRPNFMTDESAEDAFRNRVLSTIGLLRNLGHRGQDAQLVSLTASAVAEVYGLTLGHSKDLGDTLHSAVTILLQQFPHSLEATATSDAAKRSSTGPKPLAPPATPSATSAARLAPT